MNIVYLILAHNNSMHLQRLINAISSNSSDIFIHIDRKSNMQNFSSVNGDRVHFILERIPVV